MDHQCLHETDLAIIKERLPRIEEKIDKITDLLKGNGGEGLITKIALFKQSLNKAWWWLGGISLGLLGLVFFVLRAQL